MPSPGSATRTCPRRWPPWCSCAGRRTRRRPASTWALIHFQRLLRDPPFTLVGSIVDTDLRPLPPDTPLPVLTGYLATYNIVAAPVVDEGGHLLGAVTVDDVLDHMLPDDWRDSTPPHPNEEHVSAPQGAGRGGT